MTTSPSRKYIAQSHQSNMSHITFCMLQRTRQMVRAAQIYNQPTETAYIVEEKIQLNFPAIYD